MSEVEFPVKTIRWSQYEQLTPILLQEENGPCPLLALVNTLLLRSDIEARTWDLEDSTRDFNVVIDDSSAPADNAPIEGSSSGGAFKKKRQDTSKLRSLLKKNVGDRVLLADILGCLGDLLLDLTNVDSEVINTLLENLPLLHTGLDVNPNLYTGRFPSDFASQIFSVFDLNFVHAWRWEPCIESPADRVFRELQTFDGIHDYLLGSASEGDAEAKHDVRSWLEDNSTQLTAYGLQKLDSEVKEDLVAVFFRNNHFSTLYKANDHGFYLLITDTVFLKSNKYVWQSLNSASGGDDIFFTGEFLPILDNSDFHVEADEEDDMKLLQRLQEQEDSEYAKRLQRNYDTKKTPKKQGKTGSEAAVGPFSQGVSQDTIESNEKTKGKKSKRRPNCVIC